MSWRECEATVWDGNQRVTIMVTQIGPPGNDFMPDDQLENAPSRQHRVRERAYRLWEAEGRQHGRDQEYWLRAEVLISMEDAAEAGRLPNSKAVPGQVSRPKTEPAKTQNNQGEFPEGVTDQPAQQQTPKKRVRARKDKATTTRPGAS